MFVPYRRDCKIDFIISINFNYLNEQLNNKYDLI